MLESLQETILQSVLSFLGIPQDSNQRAIDPPSMPANQFFKRVCVSGLHLRYDRSVRVFRDGFVRQWPLKNWTHGLSGGIHFFWRNTWPWFEIRLSAQTELSGVEQTR